MTQQEGGVSLIAALRQEYREEMLAHLKSMPRFASATSIRHHNPDSNHSSNSGVARVSWKEDERSPAKKDIEDYLLKDLLLSPTSTKVEMRLSRRSAFVLCDREEGAQNELAAWLATYAM